MNKMPYAETMAPMTAFDITASEIACGRLGQRALLLEGTMELPGPANVARVAPRSSFSTLER
ncbi:MAG: hypothetical protein FWF24_00120 [Alphaproteobacteria bacterium]|nr:hypothetical protein [Alphaproteobacteria bacterium]